MAELPEPAAGARDEDRPAPHEPVEDEGLVVPRVQGAVHVCRPHDRDGQAPRAVPAHQRVLARDLVLRVLAPVEAPRRVLAIGDGQGVVVDTPRRDEERVSEATRERLQHRLDVRARRRRVGDVDERVHALSRELRAERGVVRPVADDRANAGRQPLGSAPAVRDHDLVAVAEERADQVDADELRASDHQHTHLRPHTDRTVLEDPATTPRDNVPATAPPRGRSSCASHRRSRRSRRSRGDRRRRASGPRRRR